MMIDVAAVSAIGFAGMFIRGLTGFGSALVMTPLLLFYFDVQTTVIIVSIVEIFGSVTVTLHARRDFDRGLLKRLLPVTIAGIAAGSYALVNFDNELLKRFFGFLTVLFAARIVFNLWRQAPRRNKWGPGTVYPAGALAGLLGGIFGTAGPPITIFLENQIDSQRVLRATLLVYFFALDAIRLGGYGVSGIIGADMLIPALVVLPASLAGAYSGQLVEMRLNERMFRGIVAGLLLVTGCLLGAGN